MEECGIVANVELSSGTGYLGWGPCRLQWPITTSAAAVWRSRRNHSSLEPLTWTFNSTILHSRLIERSESYSWHRPPRSPSFSKGQSRPPFQDQLPYLDVAPGSSSTQSTLRRHCLGHRDS